MCKNGACQFCVEVAKVDEEIDQAIATVRHLRVKRANILSERNRAHDLMHRLPLELKGYIFELVLSGRNEWGWIRGSMGRMPSYLTSICRSWRDIAWSIPSLWSTISIVVGTRSTSDSSWVNFVHSWILRSRTLPLTFLIKVLNNNEDSEYESEELEDDFKEQLYDVLKVMSQCPNEWQTLSLDIWLPHLHVFDDNSDFQSRLHTVRRLKITCWDGWGDIDRPVPPSNPKMNPEKIEIYGLSFQSLQISWNRLTSAKVEGWNLEGIAQLFQHASQMTCCHIFEPRHAPNFAMPPIIHQRLQTLRFDSYQAKDVVPILLGSLTLPCLRAIRTDLGAAENIPALVHRSSCPLSRIAFWRGGQTESFDLRPLPGVTELVLELDWVKDMGYSDKPLLKKLLLEGYLPDLRQLTLGSALFRVLLDVVLPDVRNKLTLRKIFVRGADHMEDRDLGQKVKVFQSSNSWREDGFEMILLGVVSSDEDTLLPVP
jgi:hypothetical protein